MIKMIWRVMVYAKTVNAEGGLSDARYPLWGTHYEPEDVPYIPRIGEHVSFTIDKNPETHLKVIDIKTVYINYNQCHINIICDRVIGDINK
jgi:hypothetical protein